MRAVPPGLADAHRALVARGAIQFDLPATVPATVQPPAWWAAVLRWLAWVFRPVARMFGWVDRLLPAGIVAHALLWIVVAALATVAVWVLIQSLRAGAWRWPWRRAAPADESAPEAWAPEPAFARALLKDADALAAAGQYEAAARLLLRHSIGDIARRRPRLVEPALTSRDIADAPDLPEAARSAFQPIVALVERSLFGGRPVARDAWEECRRAYADFALPRAWA